jgi:hypothetical protein
MENEEKEKGKLKKGPVLMTNTGVAVFHSSSKLKTL